LSFFFNKSKLIYGFVELAFGDILSRSYASSTRF